MNATQRAICPFCSLHCADLRFTINGGRLAGFSPACPLGKAGFRTAVAGLHAGSSPDPTSALQTTRSWLREARQPLVVLSGDIEDEAVSAAVRLAEKYSAILTCDEDLTGSVLGLSMQTAGLLSVTLGDLRSLELAVLCGVDPRATHPRLEGYLGRDLATAALRLDPPNPLEAVRHLRLAGQVGGENLPEGYTEAATRISAARSGLVVFGPAWLKAGQTFTTELLLWFGDLGRDKRWYGLYLAPASNSTGLVETLLAETGYPGSLRLDPRGIEYSPREWQAERLLQGGRVDLTVLVGQPAALSNKALAHLSQGRTILLDPSPPTRVPALWLPTARAGLDTDGHVLRLDGVPVDLKPVLPSTRASYAEFLSELSQGQPA